MHNYNHSYSSSMHQPSSQQQQQQQSAPFLYTTAPMSTAPMSTAPMSTAPMSTAPMSAAPMSTAPTSAAPTSAAPMSMMDAVAWYPSAEEQRRLEAWFLQLGGGAGRVLGPETASFLLLSGLHRDTLRTIWATVDSMSVGFLTRAGFYNLMRLVALALHNRPATLASLQATAHEVLPLPKMESSIAPASALPLQQQQPQQLNPVASKHEDDDDEFGDFEDAPVAASTATATVHTPAPASLLDVRSPFDDFMSTSTAEATPVPQKTDHHDVFSSVQDSAPLSGPINPALQKVPTTAALDDFGDFEQAPSDNNVSTQKAAPPLLETEPDLFSFEPSPNTQSPPQQPAAGPAPFRGVDDDWKRRMAALDDLVELDLATAKEDWQDFKDATQIDDAAEDAAEDVAKNVVPVDVPAASDASTGKSAGQDRDDDWLDFSVADAGESTVETQAQASASKSSTAHTAVLDLLDFDAPVVAEKPVVASSTLVVPNNFAPVPLPQVQHEHATTLAVQDTVDDADDVSNDEWTDFEEMPPAVQQTPDKDDVTSAELELLAEQLDELNHFDAAYQCLYFSQVLKQPEPNSQVIQTYKQQLTHWRRLLQRNERGEGVEDVIEIMEQIEPQCAERYKKGFISVAASKATDLRSRIIHHLICKRAARVMLTTRTTHREATKGWARLLDACHSLLEQCVARMEVFPRLGSADQSIIRADPGFHVFVQGMLECLTCCMYLLASHKEAGLIPESHKPALYKAALVSLVPFLTEAEVRRCKSMTIDGLVAEAAIKAADLQKCGYCNFTLRPLVSLDGTTRASKKIEKAQYIFSIAQLWEEVVREKLPDTDCTFD